MQCTSARVDWRARALVAEAELKKLKLVKSASRRRVTEEDGEQYFRTFRLAFLSRPQEAAETSKNSLQVETQAKEKNSQEDWVETCQVCNGTGSTKAGPWQAWSGRCTHCRGTGEWKTPAECNPQHASLDEALSCDLCQCVIRTITQYRAAAKAVNHRGTEKNPCEKCGATAGAFQQNGFYRCNKCGYPGQ